MFTIRKISIAILCASAVSYLWFSSYRLGVGLTLSTLLAGFAIYLAALKLLNINRIYFVTGFKSQLVTSLCLLLWAAFVYMINGLGLHRRLFQIALGIAISFTVYAIADNYYRIKLLIIVMIVGGTVSAIVGLGQYLLGEPFVSIWLSTGEVSEASIQNVLGGRIAGLAVNTVMLSYHLATLLPVCVAFWWGIRRKGSRLTALGLAIMILLMAFALLLTQVRSAIAGAFLGSTFAIFLERGRPGHWFRPLIAGIVVCIILYIVAGWFYEPTRFLAMEDMSARSRLPMQIAAIRYAFLYPFGTGIYLIDQISEDLVGFDDPFVAGEVFTNTAHNQFLNILIYYGWFGLALLLTFYAILLSRTHALYRLIEHCNSPRIKWLPAGIAGSIISYLVNSFFHNAGPFVGDVFHWYLIGIVFSSHLALMQFISTRTNISKSYITERIS